MVLVIMVVEEVAHWTVLEEMVFRVMDDVVASSEVQCEWLRTFPQINFNIWPKGQTNSCGNELENKTSKEDNMWVDTFNYITQELLLAFANRSIIYTLGYLLLTGIDKINHSLSQGGGRWIVKVNEWVKEISLESLNKKIPKTYNNRTC